ncbi:hypothetical protein OIDMADRAFT_127915, partial [Oidiodendron maius Zn]
VISVDISPDGKQVVSGSWDRTVWLWDMAIGAVLQALGVHLGLVYSGSVYSVAFLPSGKQVVSRSKDKKSGLRMWQSEQCCRRLKAAYSWST